MIGRKAGAGARLPPGSTSRTLTCSHMSRPAGMWPGGNRRLPKATYA